MQLFRDGVPWWPDKEFERKYIQPEQDKRFEADPWEDPISGYLARTGSVRGVVGIMSGIISENLMIAYYAERSNC